MSVFSEETSNTAQCIESCIPINPNAFQHPMAYKISWSPLTEHLTALNKLQVKINKKNGNLYFSNSPLTLYRTRIALICAIFLLFNCGYQFVRTDHFSYFSLFISLILVAGNLSFSNRKGPVFDVNLHGFYVLPASRRDREDPTLLNSFVPFENILALQLLGYYRGKKRRWWGYELNLVCKDGQRRAIVSIADYKSLRHHAEILSERLQLPLWDVVKEH